MSAPRRGRLLIGSSLMASLLVEWNGRLVLNWFDISRRKGGSFFFLSLGRS